MNYKKLINKLSKISDTFSLAVDYGVFFVSEVDSSKILGHLYNQILDSVKILWDQVSPNTKNDLPSFDDFIENVTKKRERFVFASDSLDDIVDLSLGDYYLRDTKKPDRTLWQIYAKQDFYAYCQVYHKELNTLDSSETRNVYDVLNNHTALLNNLNKYELVHSYPGTLTSQLKIVYHIKLNNETLDWLLAKNDLFNDFVDLQDLSFYKNKQCIFYSVTHEKFSS